MSETPPMNTQTYAAAIARATAANVGAWERLEDIAESYDITLVGEGEGRDTPRNPNRVWCARSSKGPGVDETARWTQFRRHPIDVTWGFEGPPIVSNHGAAPYFILVGGEKGHVDPTDDLRRWKALGYTLHPWTGQARAIILGTADADGKPTTAKEAEV